MQFDFYIRFELVSLAAWKAESDMQISLTLFSWCTWTATAAAVQAGPRGPACTSWPAFDPRPL
jgi:hypothetical protein